MGPWFDVLLEDFHKGCKIGVIKVLRHLVCDTLSEAVGLVETTPSVVRRGLLLGETEDLREQLERGYGVTPWPGGPTCRGSLRVTGSRPVPVA